MSDDSELLTYVLKNDKAYHLLEYIYVNGKVSSNIARKECDNNTLNILKTKRLIDRRFLKRGSYVSSIYWISRTGKYIYELAVLLKRERNV